MFSLHNKTQDTQLAEGLRSVPNLPADESTWRPSLRRMTKKIFSGSSKSPTRPSRPALPPGWMDDNKSKTPNLNDPPHTSIPETPRGQREPSHEKLSFVKRSISMRDKNQPLSPRKRMHVSKPSIGESSFTHSAASTEYTQMACDNRYPDTDAETSPSSTLPQDLLTPTGNRTSYASKRSENDYTNTSILLPTVYQPPRNNAIIDVSLDSFPAPPLDPYLNSPNVNPHVNSPFIFFSPSPIIHHSPLSPESKEGPQGLQRLSIVEHPETLAFLSSPSIHEGENQKTTDQLNDDFQLFLAKSRTQAKKRNSMLSQHNFKPDPEIHNTPRTSKVLDDITAAHNANKRLSQTPSTTDMTLSGMESSKPRPFSLQAAPQPRERVQPNLRSSSPPTLLRPDSQVISPELQTELSFSSPKPLESHPITANTPQPQLHPAPQTPQKPIPTQPATPLHDPRFSVDSRPYNNSASSSLYGKMRDYMFPSRSRPVSRLSNTSATHPSATINNITNFEVPRLHKDKSYGTLGAAGVGGTGTRRSGGWSRVGRSIKRSFSTDSESEKNAARMGGEFMNDRDDLRGVYGERVGGSVGLGKRRSRIIPTSRGLDRYNRTVNGGYWK